MQFITSIKRKIEECCREQGNERCALLAEVANNMRFTVLNLSSDSVEFARPVYSNDTEVTIVQYQLTISEHVRARALFKCRMYVHRIEIRTTQRGLFGGNTARVPRMRECRITRR